MLQLMRRFAKSLVFKVFAYILIAAFALTGVSAGFMADFSDNYMIKVAGEKIYPHKVERRYQQLIANIQAQGVNFTEEQFIAMGVNREQILKKMVEEKLLSKAIVD